MNERNEQLDNFTRRGEDRNRELAAQVGRLQRQIENGATEEVTELRGALGIARDRLIEQNTLLQQLTAAPLVLAVVLRVDTENINKQFIPGAKVRISPDAGDHADETATVIQAADQDGEIRVRFDDGGEQYFNIGKSKRKAALKIPRRKKVTPRDFQEGVRVKVVGRDEDDRTRFIGKIGIVVNDDNNGFREVRFEEDNCSAWFWVGKFNYVSLVEQLNGSVIVLHEGKQFEVALPLDKKISAGSTVKLNLQTMQIVEVGKPVYAGGISIVRRAIDDKTSEVETEGSVRVVLNGMLKTKPEVGDRVVLEATATVIGLNLGKEDERFSFTSETNVTWDDIGGLAEAKKQMVEAIELPFRYPDIYKHYGKKPIKGVLLYGPPGCGKTMLGKAAATALAKLHNGKSISSGFIYVKGPEILDRFVGVAEVALTPYIGQKGRIVQR